MASALFVCTGCETTGSTRQSPGRPAAAAESYIDAEEVEKRDDIVRIVQFWGQDPWIYDSIGRAIGFKVPTYYVSSETEKGAFVSGRCFVWLHIVQRSQTGDLVRRTVHMWQMDQKESFLFASRKKAIGGYFYGFILTWPGSLDLSGQTLEIEFAYERTDGRLVLSAGRTFRVPMDPREAFQDPRALQQRGQAPPPAPAPAPRTAPRREQPPAPARQAEPPVDAAEQGGSGNSPALDELLKRARKIQRRQREEAEAGGKPPEKDPPRDEPRGKD